MMQSLVRLEDKMAAAMQMPKLRAEISANKSLLYFAAVIALIGYGYEIFSFSLRIDAEFYAQNSEPNLGWIAQGRWVMFLLNTYLFPDVVMPVMPPLVAVAGICLGSFFFILSMAGGRDISRFLAMALLITSPVFYFANYFTTLGYGVGIGFMFAGIANYALFKGSWNKWLIVVVFYVLVMGVYQALLPVIAVMFGLSVLDHFLDKQSDLKYLFVKTAVFFAAIVIAYLSYAYIKDLMIGQYGLSFDEAYLSNFNQFQFSLEFLKNSFEASWDQLKVYYLGGESVYLYDLTVLGWLFSLAFVIGLIRISCQSKNMLARLIAVLVFVAVLITPMAMLMMNSGLMPPRTMIAVPVVVAGLVFFAAKWSSGTIKFIMVLLVVVCVFKCAVVLNRYSLANMTQWEADKIYSSLLIADLNKQWDKLPSKSIHSAYPIEIVGVHFERETAIMPNREVIGASFYQWGAGDLSRIIGLFQAMGIHDYTSPTNAESRIKLIPHAIDMPSWPKEGSVQVIDEIIVLKIDEYNWNQILRICEGYWEREECKLAKSKVEH